MRRNRLLGALLAGLISLNGCASLLMEATGGASTGRKIEAAKVEQIKRGVTTKAEVLNLLGKPAGRSTGSGSETWQYEYASTSMLSGTELQSLVIAFRGDVVVDVQFSEQAD